MANKNMKKRAGIAVLAGVVTAGALGASAASLGNLNVQTLGEAQGKIVSCQADGVPVDVNFKTDIAGTSGTTKRNVTGVDVSNFSKACEGGAIQVAVLNDNNQVIGKPVSGTIKDLKFSGDFAKAPEVADANGVVVTVSGAPVKTA